MRIGIKINFIMFLLLLVLMGCTTTEQKKKPNTKDNTNTKLVENEIEELIKSTEFSSKKLTGSLFEGTVTINKNLNKKLQSDKFDFQVSMNIVNDDVKIKDNTVYTMNVVDETETFSFKLNIKDKKMLSYIRNKGKDLDYLKFALTFIDKEKNPIFIRSYMFPKSEVKVSK